MRKFIQLFVLLFATNAIAGANWPYADYNQSRAGDYLLISVSNSPGNFTTKRIPLRDLFNGTNQSYRVGDYTVFQTANASEPGQLVFSSTAHGGGHGIVILGGTSGDVVLNPTANDGVMQLGISGYPGNWIYFQYAVWPYLSGQKGFSHPVEFRSKVNLSGTVYDKQPGIVGYPINVDASKMGKLVLYSIAPHWNAGNTNINSPNIAGVEVLSVGTNGVIAPSGITFIGDGSGLTNVTASGGGGLTTNIVVMSAGQPLVQYFTNGSLAAISTDADASNYISAVLLTGATLTDNQKLAVTKFTVSRKWTGTWSDADRIAPVLGGTSAAHAIYLKGSTPLTWSATPTHSASGVTFDGVVSYADTGWKSSDGPNYIQDSGRIVLVVPTASATFTSFSYLAGAVTTTGGTRYQSFFRNTGTSIAMGGFNNANGNGGETTASTIRGVMLGTRTASNAQANYFWQNTVAVGAAGSTVTSSAASSGINNHNLYIGARNYEAFPADNFSAFTCSGFESGAGCDATRAQLIRDAWAQLQIDLGR